MEKQENGKMEKQEMGKCKSEKTEKVKMEKSHFNYRKVKRKYLKYLYSQEVMSEPFRDKVGQLNKFYLPISHNINKYYKRAYKIILEYHKSYYEKYHENVI